MGEMPNSPEPQTENVDATASGEAKVPAQGGQTVEELNAQIEALQGQVKSVTSESIERRKLLKKYEEDAKSKEDLQLAEQNKWKELAERREADITTMNARIQDSAINAKVTNALMAEGINPEFIEGATRLIDSSGIIFDDTSSSVHGVEEAVAKLKAAYSPFFQQPAPVPTVKGNEGPTIGDPKKAMSQDDLAKLPADQIVAHYKNQRGK